MSTFNYDDLPVYIYIYNIVSHNDVNNKTFCSQWLFSIFQEEFTQKQEELKQKKALWNEVQK